NRENFHRARRREPLGSVDLNQWFIYLVRSRPGHLYTGITTDVERRLREHAGGSAGARSLRGKGPLSLAYSAPAGDRSRASRLEAAIKKLDRRAKERLVAGLLP